MMVRLKLWQWLVLIAPIASIVAFLLVAAGLQIHEWGINWIWGIFTLVFVGWRWLLVGWTQPIVNQVEAAVADVSKELETSTNEAARLLATKDTGSKAENTLQKILQKSQNDLPIWEDWQTFWQRCQELVVEIAHIYYPEVKYPLLNIYIPQAYSLIRGTVDDLDLWMQKLSPALDRVTIGQAYEAYEIYRKLEPSTRKILQVWNLAQWFLNPVAAVAQRASKNYSERANRQLLVNLNQILREAALRNLAQRSVTLYGGSILKLESVVSAPTLPKVQTKTLREILTQAEPIEKVEQKPVSILLVGRTGAGKSSLINSLFRADLAAVDVLPSTEELQDYRWQTSDGEQLTLWDTPGYEQVDRDDLRERVLDYASKADLLLLATPALDPSLQVDVDFLKDVRQEVTDLPIIALVTQVDRLRPIREWQASYDWQSGEKEKEKAIREATEYRAQFFGDLCQLVLPIVTQESQTSRTAWGIDALSLAIIETIEPAKQLRLARFLQDLDARSVAAAKIIDRYTFQMTTTQGLTALLKSPVLQFISTLSTGSPNLAYLLAEKIPVEELPIVIGKLQMAYDLFVLLNPEKALNFDLLLLWPLLLENSASPETNARSFGYALVEFWTQNLTIEQFKERFEYYKSSKNNIKSD
jgi:hypothetical protein